MGLGKESCLSCTRGALPQSRDQVWRSSWLPKQPPSPSAKCRNGPVAPRKGVLQGDQGRRAPLYRLAQQRRAAGRSRSLKEEAKVEVDHQGKPNEITLCTGEMAGHLALQEPGRVECKAAAASREGRGHSSTWCLETPRPSAASESRPHFEGGLEVRLCQRPNSCYSVRSLEITLSEAGSIALGCIIFFVRKPT